MAAKKKTTPKLERPSVLTDEAKDVILRMVGEGNYLKVACEAAGFCYHTLRYWRELSEKGSPQAETHADFFTSLKSVGAVAEGKALSEIRKGDSGWQGNAWFLERRYPQRWGKKDRTPDPLPPKPLAEMSDEEFKAYHEQLESKGRR